MENQRNLTADEIELVRATTYKVCGDFNFLQIKNNLLTDGTYFWDASQDEDERKYHHFDDCLD